MTTLATGLIGAAVGGVIGAPGLGFSLGAALGQSFLGGKGQHTYRHQEGSRLSDLKVQSSQVGIMIPTQTITLNPCRLWRPRFGENQSRP